MPPSTPFPLSMIGCGARDCQLPVTALVSDKTINLQTNKKPLVILMQL